MPVGVEETVIEQRKLETWSWTVTVQTVRLTLPSSAPNYLTRDLRTPQFGTSPLMIPSFCDVIHTEFTLILVSKTIFKY